MAGSELHVPERHAGVEGGHDECCSEHVGVYPTESGAFADRTDPAMRGAAIDGSMRQRRKTDRRLRVYLGVVRGEDV